MKKRAFVFVLLVQFCLCFVSFCHAYTQDMMWDLEAVNSNGLGIHPKVNADVEEQNKVIVEGIALAGSNEILDPNGTTQWVNAYTVFLQQDGSDKGGIQAWAGAWFYGSQWALYRTTHYIDFNAGDRLRITGYLQDAGRGKVVINHRHSTDPDLVFKVEVIGHPGLPDPVLIPNISDCNYFDQSRLGGGERYQTRYVMLHDVQITGGTWGNNQLLTISDITGSVGMLLSRMGDFNSYSQPSSNISVVGIFDQEDTTFPHTSNYRIWVKKYSDIARALDFCREVRNCADGERVALVNKMVTRVFDGYLYIEDQDRSGGVRIISDRLYEPGDVICVHGVVSTQDNEKVITPKYIFSGRTNARPVFVNSRALWGQNGLDVFGMLVKCYATIGTLQGDGTYSMTDDAGYTIYLSSLGVEAPAEGTKVIVTGIADQINGAPLIRISKGSDIQIVQ